LDIEVLGVVKIRLIPADRGTAEILDGDLKRIGNEVETTEDFVTVSFEGLHFGIDGRINEDERNSVCDADLDQFLHQAHAALLNFEGDALGMTGPEGFEFPRP
jgi:hypothetical protein